VQDQIDAAGDDWDELQSKGGATVVELHRIAHRYGIRKYASNCRCSDLYGTVAEVLEQVYIALP
jgi:hypothetical protein